MKSRNPMNIEVVRGSVVESVHQVMAVIMDQRGLVMGYAGNPEYLVPPRSAIKMLQALPFAESSAFQKYSLEEKHLALACSSHRGEKQHLLLASQWLEALNLQESALWCGPAWPTDVPTEHEMIRKGLQPTPIIHNCSGKHLGMISTALAMGEDPKGYQNWEHPVQVRIRKALTNVTKFNHDRAIWSVDGCGLPTYALPLQNIALGMAALMTLAAAPASPAQKILEACKKHPELISGTNDFVTVLNEKTFGRSILKSGAEGTFAAMIPEKGIAFALKVHDGNGRAAQVAASHLLRAYGGLTDKEYLELKDFTMPIIKNSRGEKVGEIRLEKGLS